MCGGSDSPSTTGDLRCQQTDCGLFRHFSLPVSNIPRDVALDAPLDIGVGGDGIIGRRVSLCSGPVASPDNTVAQGIVGFNFVQPAL